MVKCNVKFTFSYLLFLILMLYVSKISEIIIISLSIFIHELFHVFISFIFGNRKIKIEVSMFHHVSSHNPDGAGIYLVQNPLCPFVCLMPAVHTAAEKYTFVNTRRSFK